MSIEAQRVPEAIPERDFGSLRGCLVEGDPEQRRRERRIRRRSLAISVALQSTILAAVVLLSLFGKAERIAFAKVTPVPPYSPYRDTSHNSGTPRTHPNGPPDPCHYCAPLSIPHTVATHVADSSAGQTDDALPDGIGDSIPGAIDSLIPLSDSRKRVLPPPNAEHQPSRPRLVRMTTLDPAMLIHRVEPAYPPLARQTHREGRVELRAIIGIDGTIQSLQIVASDPLFDLSAKEAVSQWRYRPTILNGQPVEIDTYITVVYIMQH